MPLHEWTDVVDPEAEVADKASQGGSTVIDRPITWIFKPGSFAPLAKLMDGKAYSILTNPIGTPLSLCDQEGQEIWSAKVDIYGKVEKSKGPRSAVPFRFPGQYEDDETGLYYNRFRYYDPETGRYISQDPLKIKGGLNPYAYSADSLGASDPFGLASLFRGDDGYTGGDMGRPLVATPTSRILGTTSAGNPAKRASSLPGRRRRSRPINSPRTETSTRSTGPSSKSCRRRGSSRSIPPRMSGT